MLLYTNPDKVFDNLNEYIKEFSSLVNRLVNTHQFNSVFSREIPDMPDGKLIFFFSYKKRVVFYVERGDGIAYARKVPQEEINEFVITPCTFDLPSGTLKNKEDLL